MNALVYDIEIINAVPYRNEPRIQGINYCEGWHNHKNMGISVICAYDFARNQYRVFCKDNFDVFYNLAAQRDLLVGFNNIRFDDEVIWQLNSNFGIGVERYDLLREIWISLGLNPDEFNWRLHGGLGLDAVCIANSIGDKTGHGASAPVLWQQGSIGKVIDYCLNDIWLTKELFIRSQRGTIINPKGGELLLRQL